MSENQTDKKNVKNPILAIILSALLPGLGQIYNSQFGKGLFFIAFNMIINFLIREPLLAVIDDPKSVDQPTMVVFIGYSLAGMVLWVYSIIDAKKNADRINSEANKI
ncbi:MAG: hypothetical protein ACR2NC_03705 [Thermodesulfobacteriota bacterium]